MLMNTPTISVIMPVYNGEQYLKEAVDSILHQTFKDFEFIIVNDGSTDKTEEIILSYSDKRIRYIQNKQNLKIAKTLNKEIELAKGKYIARMDADDISLPERFEKQIQFMRDNPNIDVCGTWLQTFGDIDDTWRHPLIHDEIKMYMLTASALMHPTVLGKRQFFVALKYNESMPPAEDYDLWVRGVDEYQYANISEVLLYYRIHDSTTDQKYKNQKANECRKRMLAKFGCCLTDKEFDCFLHFIIPVRKKRDIRNLENVCHTIIHSNKKNQYVPEYVCERFLRERLNVINRILTASKHKSFVFRIIIYPIQRMGFYIKRYSKKPLKEKCLSIGRIIKKMRRRIQ